MPNSEYFDIPFAENGPRASVPDGTQVDGSVSYNQGYGPNYTLAPGTPGALNVDNSQMNQVFYDITVALQQYQQTGIPPFITTAMNNGSPFSYAQYATVIYNGTAYISNSANNTDTPPSSKWNPVNLASPNQFTGSTISGTANAIVVGTTNPSTGLSLSIANQTLVFTPSATNTNSTFLAVTNPSITSTIIQKLSGGVLVNLTGGEIVSGVPCYLSVNNVVPCWVLQAGPALGTIAPLNIGNNMANDTNGNAVAQVPPLPLTGASKTFTLAEWGAQIARSASGSPMTDTLPGTTGALPSGWFIQIQNTDATAADVVSVAAGGSITLGNQSLTSTGFVIEPGETYAVYCHGAGAYIVQRVSTSTLHAGIPSSLHKKLAAVWASNTTASMSADAVVVQDANGNTRRLTSYSQTVNSATSGAGGLDTGSVSNNTWYYLYAIYNPATNTQSILMSASATSPTLPSGYIFASGPLSAALTDGSAHFLGFKQIGVDYQYVVGNNLTGLPQLISGASGSISTPTWTAVAIGGACPTSIAAKIKLLLATVATAGEAMAAPNNSYGSITSTSNPPPMASNPNTIGGISNIIGEFVPESTNVYYAASTSGCSLSCMGFTVNI